MNQADLAIFSQAVTLAQLGQKTEAYQQLKALSKTNGNHNDANILLWLAFTTPDLAEAEAAINMAASAEPGNAGLAGARNWLVKEKSKQPPVAPIQQPVIPQPQFQAQSQTPYMAAPTWPPNPTQTQQPMQPMMGQPQPYFVPQVSQGPVGYYPQPIAIPQRRLSGGAMFGYFILYFIACIVIIIVSSVVAYTIEPTTYSSYYGRYYEDAKTGSYQVVVLLLLVLITSIWAAFDASQRRSKFGPKSITHPLSVFLGCGLLWVIIFPLYLTQRHKAVAFYGS